MGMLCSLSCSKQPQPVDVLKSSIENSRAQIDAAAEAARKVPSFENFINYGLVLAGAGKHEESLEAYKKAAKINPAAPVAQNNICTAYFSMKRWTQALPFCKKAIELQPGFQLAKNNLQFVSQQKAADDASIALIQSKLQQSSAEQRDPLLIEIGMRFYQSGDFEKSLEYWKKIPSKSPQYNTALNNIASSLIILGRFDAAERNLRAALKRDPKNPLFLNNLAWLQRARLTEGH